MGKHIKQSIGFEYLKLRHFFVINLSAICTLKQWNIFKDVNILVSYYTYIGKCYCNWIKKVKDFRLYRSLSKSSDASEHELNIGDIPNQKEVNDTQNWNLWISEAE